MKNITDKQTNMTKIEFKKQLSLFRKQKQKLLNDTYLWATLAINSLKSTVSLDERTNDMLKFRVPAKVKIRIVNRKLEDIKNIINNAADKELYQILLTYIVAQFESFLVDIISLMLIYNKHKLESNCEEENNNQELDSPKLLERTYPDDFITPEIEKQLTSLTYKNLKEQIEYIRANLGFEIDEEKWNKWIEYKATRDLLIHNSGIINERYIKKAKSHSRGSIGEEIIVNKIYFENLLILTKSLIGIMVYQAKKHL